MICLLPTVAFAAQFKPEGFKGLAIGDAAPEFTLPGTDGKEYKLADFSEPDVLMVYFTGTHCPVSHAIESRLQKLVIDMKDKSFKVVAINPNHNDGLRLDEFSYSRYNESFESSKQYAEDLGWQFPFLYDGEKQTVARHYGVLATPHLFIFDKERKLQYQGRFDDSRYKDPATVNQSDARNAVEAMIAGKPVPVAVTKPFGCSTKWREKKAGVIADNKKWAGTKAVIEEIDSKGIKALRENGTKNVRLFNVWSTDCVPCVQEMPDVAKILRKYSRRHLEVITISLDDPANKARAEELLGKNGVVVGGRIEASLKKQKRKTNNYLFNEASIDALTGALDDKWSGATPYTVMVNTAGEVIYRHEGIFDIKELDAAVIKELTEYFTPPKKKAETK